MDTIIATFNEITRLAPDASRDRCDMLIKQIGMLDGAGNVAISLGTLSDQTLVAVGEAHQRAVAATDLRLSQIIRAQYDLIASVPDERRSRASLSPMSAPALLMTFISSGAEEITFIGREKGEFVHALRDGVQIGAVEPYSVRTDEEHLIVDGVGKWKLEDIQAASCQEGLAFLISDGTLFEMMEAE